MKHHFQINMRYQLKSAKECFVGLLRIIFGLTIVHFFIKDSNLVQLLIIGFFYWLILFASILPFHISYLIANWKTKLTIDYDLNTLEIIQSGKVFKYALSDITAHRFILGHFKPGRTQSWIPIPFNYYGYIQIKTNDKTRFNFTSLMIDPFNPPLKIDKTEYNFPIIK